MLQLLGICSPCNDMFIYAECIFYFCLMKMKIRIARKQFSKSEWKAELNAMIYSKYFQNSKSSNPSPF